MTDQNLQSAHNWHILEALPISYEQAIESADREILFTALQISGFNATAAANLLGISYRKYRYRAGQAGLPRAGFTQKKVRGKGSAFNRAWPKLRMAALKRLGSRCHCCGASAHDGIKIDVDHIKPRNRYPTLELDIENLQILCRTCHMSKGPYDETDWRHA